MYVVTIDNYAVNLATSQRIYVDECENGNYTILVDYGNTGNDDTLHEFQKEQDAELCLTEILAAIADGYRVFYMRTWFTINPRAAVKQ